MEAHGRSAAYEALACGGRRDADIVGFVASLPAAKRQPNLLFAAARYLLGGRPHRLAARRWSATPRPSWPR